MNIAALPSSPKSWQFTAWKQLEKAFRPVRVRYDRGSTFCSRPQDGDRMPHRTKSYRLYETAFSLASFQAVNCQATLIKSLRDKNASDPTLHSVVFATLCTPWEWFQFVA